MAPEKTLDQRVGQNAAAIAEVRTVGTVLKWLIGLGASSLIGLGVWQTTTTLRLEERQGQAEVTLHRHEESPGHESQRILSTEIRLRLAEIQASDTAIQARLERIESEITLLRSPPRNHR